MLNRRQASATLAAGAALGATSRPAAANQRARRLWVVGAYYDLDEGRVDFFDLPPGAA